jgi:hypothetical protein
MVEETGGSFRTTTGTCTITSDAIVLARSGVRGSVDRALFGNSTGRRVIASVVVSAFAVVIGAWYALFSLTGNPFGVLAGVLFVLLGVGRILVMFVAVRGQRQSLAMVIRRDSIRAVGAFPPQGPGKPPCNLSVAFDEEGKTRLRVILPRGRDEYERACQLMREAGLLAE